ncbi:MAG: hypothetical protein MJ065_09015 [Oscillospiraceae bacterium]|nr:hypothetical protein [Oscillospiraceae bacterium]
MPQISPKAESRQIICPHCNVPMIRVKVEAWAPTNILLKQLQKIADHAGVRIYHCKSCGKVEFFRDC